jgi:hypothetical protein
MNVSVIASVRRTRSRFSADLSPTKTDIAVRTLAADGRGSEDRQPATAFSHPRDVKYTHSAETSQILMVTS